jgi:hypothetical protein
MKNIDLEAPKSVREECGEVTGSGEVILRVSSYL